MQEQATTQEQVTRKEASLELGRTRKYNKELSKKLWWSRYPGSTRSRVGLRGNFIRRAQVFPYEVLQMLELIW